MNEFIYNYIICIICMIGVLGCLFINIFNRLKLFEYFYIVFSMIAIISIILFINRKIATVALYILPIHFIYRKTKNLIKSIVGQATICLSMILSDCLVGFIMFDLIKIKDYKLGYIIIIIIIIISLVGIMINIFINYILNKNNIIIGSGEKSKYLVILYIVITMTCILFCISILLNKKVGVFDSISSIVFIVYMGVMAVIVYLLLFMYKKEEGFKYKQLEFKNLQEYTEKIEELYTDMRKFKHDYINIISSMSSFIEEGDTIGLKEYFYKNICPLNKAMDSNNYRLGLLKNIGVKELKGLLSGKVIRAEALNIDVVIDIVEYIDTINIDIVDLIRSMGIILDNAIEAAEGSDKKIINIAAIKKNKSIIIVVSNSFNGEILSISKIFKMGFSTKGKNRGLGLSNLSEMLGKYNHISLDTRVEDQMFVQEITIKN